MASTSPSKPVVSFRVAEPVRHYLRGLAAEEGMPVAHLVERLVHERLGLARPPTSNPTGVTDVVEPEMDSEGAFPEGTAPQSPSRTGTNATQVAQNRCATGGLDGAGDS